MTYALQFSSLFDRSTTPHSRSTGHGQHGEKAGMPRECLYLDLSPRGIKTLLAVLTAFGLQLGVTRTEQHA
jgi:DNA-binding phage protein